MEKHVLGISGGKDSAALAVYMRNHYPELDIEYFFTDTGEELPEVYEFHTDHINIYNHSSEVMKELADKSVDLVVTSPPYYMMRMYGYDVNQIGQERSHDDYIKSLLKIFSECHRVLKDDGSLFVNINE